MSVLSLSATSADACIEGVPAPIVTLNRAIIVSTLALAALSSTWWPVALLFALLAPAALIGRRASLIFALGQRLLPAHLLATAELEDKRMVRFNNGIATILLGGATMAFAASVPVLGWALVGMVAFAASLALVGFCIGCFLFLQFKLARYRFFARL